MKKLMVIPLLLIGLQGLAQTDTTQHNKTKCKINTKNETF